MANTYTWTITQLYCASGQILGLDQVVQRVQWLLTATDGVNTAAVSGEVDLGPPDPADYVAFNSLTQDTVTAWVQAQLTSVSDLQYQLDSQLSALARPPTVSHTVMPWAS
jgi:hypothetical protein